MADKGVFVRFECGSEDRMGDDLGPFEYVQQIYGTLTAAPDSTIELADFVDGRWITRDGKIWTDFVIFSA